MEIKSDSLYFHELPIGFFAIHPDGKLIETNRYFNQMFQLKTKDTNFFQLFVSPEASLAWQSLLESNETLTGFEAQFYTQQRKSKWVEINTRKVKNTFNQIFFYVGTIQDITKRKDSELKKESQSSELLTILNQIPHPLYISDPDGYSLLFVNQALQKKLGEVIGQKCHRVLHGFQSPCIFCTNHTVFEDQNSETLIWDFFNQNEKKWYRCIDKAIPWPDGRKVKYQMAIDITKEKRTEFQFNKLLENLQNTLEGTVRAISDMVEIRDPYIAGHQKRVAQLSCAIAEEMGYSQERINGLRIAGLLHDIGKIYLPQEILWKPHQLTDIEFNMIKNHPEVGYQILNHIHFPSRFLEDTFG
jgi:putative nucleotidyltransferase with HDIG domain/PAS domain S-box-containing protein